MKRLLLSAWLICIATFSFGQIPNADFSSWFTNSLGREDPTGWISSNMTSSSQMIHQDTDRTGMTGYSVRFTCDFDSSQGIFWGGELTLNHEPFTGLTRPVTVQGFYKLVDPFNSNIITIYITFYNAANAVIGIGDIAVPMQGGTVSSWTSCMDSINYTSNDPIDNYSVSLFLPSLSQSTLVSGHLDDITFDGLTPIGDFSKPRSYSLINEGENIYLIKSHTSEILSATIYDMQGKEISPETEIFKDGIRLDLTANQAGVYLCKIKSGSAEYTSKIIKY